MTPTDLDHAALLAALHAALDADPSDAATRQMLADALEDAGDPVAARGQRWQALHGRWPARSAPGGPPPEDWRWWDGAHSSCDDPDDLPWDAYRLLAAGVDYGSRGVGRYYPSRRAAEADLAPALEALAARGAVLAGYEPGPCPWCGERRQVRSGAEHACDPDGGCGRRWTA